MPYRSTKQAAFIHARAAAGEAWAQKFVRDSHGSHVLNKGEAIKQVRKRRKKRRKRR